MGVDGEHGRLVSARREVRFDVFGRRMAVVDDGRGWRAFVLGADGKRRPADIAVPATLREEELATYLGDLFHEAATPTRPDVVRLP